MNHVCVDCSGDNNKWVASRSPSNPVRTDWCSVCGHRKEVIRFEKAAPVQQTTSGYAAALDTCVDFMRGHGMSVTPAMVEELKQRLNAEVNKK